MLADALAPLVALLALRVPRATTAPCRLRLAADGAAAARE
jgi:hypothetical protein